MSSEKLHPQQKVAETLLSLAPKEVADILRGLNERELLFVGESILKYARRNPYVDTRGDGMLSHARHASSEMRKVSEYTAADDENFVPLSLGKKHVLLEKTHVRPDPHAESQSFLRVTVDDFSPLEVVRALYKISFGSKRAQNLIDKLLRLNLSHTLSFLNDYNKHHLFMALEKESVQVISVILSVLQPYLAAQVLRFFNSNKRCEIIRRIAVQQNPTENTIKTIEEVLKRKLNKISLAEKNKEEPAGEDKILEILKHLDHDTQESVLQSLENEELKEKLMYTLFNWSDLEKIPQVVLEDIFSEYDDASLAKFILIDGKDAEDALSHLFSKNRMIMITDELALLKKDLIIHAHAIEDAYRIKKQFFKNLREHVYAQA